MIIRIFKPKPLIEYWKKYMPELKKTTNFKCRNQNAYDFNDEYNIKQQKYSDKQ